MRVTHSVEVVGGPDCGRSYEIDKSLGYLLFAKELPMDWHNVEKYQHQRAEVISAPIRKTIWGTYVVDCIHVSRHP